MSLLMKTRYFLVMSGIAGIDTGIDTKVSKEVLIPKISIAMRYQKVSIPEPGIKIRYRKVSIPGIGFEIGYRKVSIPKFVFVKSISPLKYMVRNLKIPF